MDIREIRRLNLLSLKGEGKMVDIAEMSDVSASYLSQIVNRTRGMGNAMARRIESKMGLAKYTLDHDPENKGANIDAEVLASILEGVQDAARRVGKDLSLKQSAKLTASLYALYEKTGEMPNFVHSVHLSTDQAGTQ